MADTPAIATPAELLAEAEPGTSLWKDAWLRLRKNRLAVFGGLTVVLMGLFCVGGPFLSPYSYQQQDLALYAKGPSAKHWFGTDKLGRDQLTRQGQQTVTLCWCIEDRQQLEVA